MLALLAVTILQSLTLCNSFNFHKPMMLGNVNLVRSHHELRFPRFTCRRGLLPRLRMSETNNGEESAAASQAVDSSFVEIDPSKRKAKASELRREALQLDGEATKLREQALNRERKAAKLRIESWKLEGAVSAVTNTVTIGDRYEKQLAELDLVSEAYIDDPEKFEWYRNQRQMLIEMLGFQKEQEAKADEEIKELKESLVDVQVPSKFGLNAVHSFANMIAIYLSTQEFFNAQFVDDKGEITSAGENP
jgi:hypothetical protein